VFFGYLYGQGAESAARKAKEDGADVTREEAQALIDGLTDMYPGLVNFFKSCKDRCHQGWMVNCFGRYRRFLPSTDRQVMAELERQSMNYPIQSLVADAMSIALDNLYQYRAKHKLNYKFLLQIHDAVILEVPIAEAEQVYDVVLPTCMSQMVDVWPSFLDGRKKPNILEPYHLGIGREVYLSWDDPIPPIAHDLLGVPKRFCNQKFEGDQRSILSGLI
jgi:DNA polymerase I-like protein with 3'-5' exonuclease and polymerase domains